MARIVGDGKRVLIFGREPAMLSRALEAQDCRTYAGTILFADQAEGGRPRIELDPDRWTTPDPCAPEEGGVDGRFDAIVVADLLGRIEDPRAILRALQGQIRPGGSLVVTLDGITPVDGRLAIVDDRPLGAGSGVLFTDEGLLGLLEDAEYAIGHVERIEPEDTPGAIVHHRLIVAHPLPIPGLDFLQHRMRTLMEQGREAARAAEELRRRAALAEERLEILAGHERRMAGRIDELRARLLEAHAQMIARDDEIRKTFGDAIYLRNSVLIERDALYNQREELVAERAALVRERDAWSEERAALYRSLRSAQVRLTLLRASPIGLAYRALRKLVPRRGAGGGIPR